VGDIGEFLNDRLSYLDTLSLSEKHNEGNAFRNTFKYIFGELEEHAFQRYDTVKSRFLGGFSISGFEVVALGIGYNIMDPNWSEIDDCESKVQSIWSNPEFKDKSGSGVRASTRIPIIVPLGRSLFSS